jgi:hypothetical protein
MAKPGTVVNTPLGEKRLDSSGSVVGAVRIDPALAYGPIPSLLKDVIDGVDIDGGSEQAWSDIVTRINYVHDGIGHALRSLDAETGFFADVKSRVAAGQDLFFKPNIVVPNSIDQMTHGPGNIGVCTPWEFIAALMRWFHDALDVSYHRMSIGESGSALAAMAGTAGRLVGRVITPQAIVEGKNGDFTGGWGFYFARRYLADTHAAGHTDDPMAGYQESLAGVCVPPGQARDKLMVYDINKIADDGSDGRDVTAEKGINFRTITLHKAVVGGDPADAADRADWPGCVLVNVPKLKIHQVELITNAIKNLGVGLYPMEANGSDEPGKIRWKYALPDRIIPGLKARLPHNVWVGESDEKTGMPLRDADGNYKVRRTGGMEATMADVIEAVQEQDIMMVHVVDGVESTNVSHAGPGFVPTPEGFVFASTDPVAVDVVSARYLHTMVPVGEARSVQKELGLKSDAIQKVPLPHVEGLNIVTGEGYDSPYSRYLAFRHCEERGLGLQEHYVIGQDLWQGGSLATVEQRLGCVQGDVFAELLTGSMYFAQLKPLWDLQTTCFGYLEANDALTGSSYKQMMLDAFDEDGDGVINYSEKGRQVGIGLMPFAGRLGALDLTPAEMLRIRFLLSAVPLRGVRREWNVDGHEFSKAGRVAASLMLALSMSWAAEEQTDPFFPSMTWGKGKWPSVQFVEHLQLLMRTYGATFPRQFDALMSPYGFAFRYADITWNEGRYGGEMPAVGDDVIGRYHSAVAAGADPLPFTLYVPRGLGSAGNGRFPNVEETDDPSLMFTASFNGGDDAWRELSLASIP